VLERLGAATLQRAGIDWPDQFLAEQFGLPSGDL